MNRKFPLVRKVLIALIVLGGLAVGLHHSALAAPENGGFLTVNSNGDSNSADGVLTLREAISIANGGTSVNGLNRGLTDGEKNQLSGCNFTSGPAPWYITGGCGGGILDTIKFNLASCPCTIFVYSWLPLIEDSTVIDGYSNPGAVPNTSKKGMDAQIMVRLNGLSAGDNVNGLYITSGSTTVKGLDIYAFRGQGITMGTNGGNIITGNLIHENAAGGIYVASTNNEIGQDYPAGRNAIYGNGGHGIQLHPVAAYTYVYNNLIGIAPTGGTVATGNLYTGIAINSSHNYVYGNKIAFNHNSGVVVTSGTSSKIWRNSIYSNSQYGIDLGNDGITADDEANKDSDAGANNLQNFPVLSSANHLTKTVAGKLVSTPNTSFELHLYKSNSCDANGYGEGKNFLGSTSVTTNSKGIAKFSVVVKKFKAGNAITATADQGGNTSEFSHCKTAQ